MMESKDYMELTDLEQEVLKLEWEMFTTVPNEGGRASCQDDYPTFVIMRGSQMKVWSQTALESYLEDLTAAKMKGHNLLTEKYGYMMKDTAPDAYEKIRELLPALSEEKQELVESLTEMQTSWMEAFHKKYPNFGNQGRPVRQRDAVWPGETSIEAYARGELSTYSVKTLRCLKEQFEMLNREMENPAERIMDATARAYGYRDAAHAEEELCKRRSKEKE